MDFGDWQEYLDRETSTFTGFFDLIACKSHSDIITLIKRKNLFSPKSWVRRYFDEIKKIDDIGQKSDSKASNFRSNGNQFFKKRKHKEALHQYNQCILYAETKTIDGTSCQELSLGYANRSAVYYHLEMYHECIADVSAALNNNYPQHLACKLFLRNAQSHIRLCHKELAQLAIDRANHTLQHIEKSKQESMTENIRKVEKEIDSLQDDCEKSVAESTTPIPVNGFNPVITQASTALELRFSEDQGRHLVASKDIKAGDVLIVEKPFAAVLLPPHYKTHCHHCFVKLMSFYPCGQCVKVRYCSVHCKDESWKRYHCIECLYLDLLHSIGIAHLSLRVVLTASLENLLAFRECMKKSKSGHHIPGLTDHGTYEKNYLSVYELMPHSENMAPEDLFQYALTASLLLELLENCDYFEAIAKRYNKTNEPTGDYDNRNVDNELKVQHSCHSSSSLNDHNEVESHEISGVTTEICKLHMSGGDFNSLKMYIGGLLLRHVCQLVCNAHAITELQVTQADNHSLVDTQSQERIATAIYPTTSLLNHSCKPTIINSFLKDMLVVRAVKDVKAEEQIYNCYGPHAGRMSYRDRQSSLKSQYFFTCACTACITEGELESIYNAFKCPNCSGPLVTVNDEDSHCKECKVEVNISLLQKKRTEASHIFIKAIKSMDDGDIHKSLSLLTEVLTLQKEVLFCHNRDLAQTQDALAKCYSIAGDYTKAVPHLAESLKTSRFIYGNKSIEVATELQKYAEVLLHARMRVPCLQAIEEARTLFELHYGKTDQSLVELEKLSLVAKYSLIS